MWQQARQPDRPRGVAGLLLVALAGLLLAGCRSDAQDQASAVTDRARSRAAVQELAQSLVADARARAPYLAPLRPVLERAGFAR